jgi:hypothetical protein
MIPNPPIWKRKMVITWPTVVRSCPRSITTRPVTQTAEVEVKRASKNRRGSLVVEKESHRRMVPVMMTDAKLRTKILGGERCLEKKVLIRMRIFIGPWFRMDFILQSSLCQSKKKSDMEKIEQEIANGYHHDHGGVARLTIIPPSNLFVRHPFIGGHRHHIGGSPDRGPIPPDIRSQGS